MRADAVFTIATLILGSWAIHLSYENGLRDGKAKARAELAYVNEQMEKVGFCEWVKAADFAAHCRSKERQP